MVFNFAVRTLWVSTLCPRRPLTKMMCMQHHGLCITRGSQACGVDFYFLPEEKDVYRTWLSDCYYILLKKKSLLRPKFSLRRGPCDTLRRSLRRQLATRGMSAAVSLRRPCDGVLATCEAATGRCWGMSAAESLRRPCDEAETAAKSLRHLATIFC